MTKPLKKDGTPDMRYRENKLERRAQLKRQRDVVYYTGPKYEFPKKTKRARNFMFVIILALVVVSYYLLVK